MAGHPPLPQVAAVPTPGVERILALFGIDSPTELRVAQPILDVVGDAKALVRLVCAALVLALASAPGAFAGSTSVSGSGPLSGSASIDFVVKVPPIARLKIVSQAPSVRITEEDVARGFVDVPAGSRYELQANTAYGLAVRAGWTAHVPRTDVPFSLGFH